MKKFNCSITIKGSFRAKDEEDAKKKFLEDLEDESNLALASIIYEHITVKEINK